MLHPMQMTLEWDASIGKFLFQGWKANNPGLYVGALLFTVVLGMIPEALNLLKWYFGPKEYLKSHALLKDHCCKPEKKKVSA